MTDKAGFLPDYVYQYLLSISLREDEIGSHLRREIQKLSGAHMMIPPEQAQLLQFVIKLIQATRVLEVGMFAGYSALMMALALPENGELITCDISDQHFAWAKKYWEAAKVSQKIFFKHAPALQTLNDLIAQGELFDLIFIDGDKANYDQYYEQSFLLVKPGGVIALDNMLHTGRLVQVDDGTPSTQALRELNAKLKNDDRVDLTTLAIGGGMTLLRKK